MNSILDSAKNFSRLLDVEVERIESSQFYPKINERVNYLTQLESIFDSNDTIFKYDERENILTSQITGEYLLKNIVESRNIFTFLDKTKGDKYYCRSFFPQTFKDYSYRQKK